MSLDCCWWLSPQMGSRLIRFAEMEWCSQRELELRLAVQQRE
jgi:hypothetical protein